MKLKALIKKILPENILLLYHFVIAHVAAFYFGFPGRKLLVIGITGTKGKSSSANFIWSVLDGAGIKTGLIGTANIRVGKDERMNPYHMTMPGPFILQGILAEMVKADCTHLVMEATSEGMKLHRHVGIDFDFAVFTNLTPEHLPSHNYSFDNYREAKTLLFRSMRKTPKIIDGGKVPRTFVVNQDDANADYYLKFPADQKITYGLVKGELKAEQIKDLETGVSFMVKGEEYSLSVLGKFNIYNALPAIAVGQTLKIKPEVIKQGLKNLRLIPGRMEQINMGQKFRVFVDYAHEKASFSTVLDATRNFTKDKIIVLMGGQGGGRDKTKRALMGEVAAKKSDVVICSNEDPYEDDPREIIEEIAEAAEKFGKVRNQNLFVILDRRAGINKALTLASPEDTILITGKGAEQSMIVGNKKIPWDDRVVVKEELKKIL
jgi:UDP-N-acetylmuramoyl-L-alanyl-D-glutamate--2,6-diaminopimelate ligase